MQLIVDGVLGIQTWYRRMEGADEFIELWRPRNCLEFLNKLEHLNKIPDFDDIFFLKLVVI